MILYIWPLNIFNTSLSEWLLSHRTMLTHRRPLTGTDKELYSRKQTHNTDVNIFLLYLFINCCLVIDHRFHGWSVCLHYKVQLEHGRCVSARQLCVQRDFSYTEITVSGLIRKFFKSSVFVFNLDSVKSVEYKKIRKWHV